MSTFAQKCIPHLANKVGIQRPIPGGGRGQSPPRDPPLLAVLLAGKRHRLEKTSGGCGGVPTEGAGSSCLTWMERLHQKEKATRVRCLQSRICSVDKRIPDRLNYSRLWERQWWSG